MHRCWLEPRPQARRSEADVRALMLDLVTDENLREKLAMETAPTRNLILALAFGALAADSDPPPNG
jgi:hypothetical protein